MPSYFTPDPPPWRTPLLTGLLGLLVGGGLVWALRAPAPAEPPIPEEVPVAVPVPERETAPAQPQVIEGADPAAFLRCERELTAAQSSLRELGTEQARLIQRAEAAEAELVRTRQALEQAMVALGGQARGTPAPSSASRRPSTRQARASVSSLSGPTVGVEGYNLVARGKLYNAGDAGAQIELDVDLLDESGRVLDTETTYLEVGAHTARPWAVTFRIPPQDGRAYGVNIRMRGR